MISASILGTVFEPLKTIQTPSGKTINKFVIKVQNGKDSFFIEVLVSDMSMKYAQGLVKDQHVFVSGEPTISAYVSKTNEPKAKLSLYAKSLKGIGNSKPANLDLPEIGW